MIELLILYRDLILLNFSSGTELIIIPLSIPAPNSDWTIFSSEGLSPYQTILVKTDMGYVFLVPEKFDS